MLSIAFHSVAAAVHTPVPAVGGAQGMYGIAAGHGDTQFAEYVNVTDWPGCKPGREDAEKKPLKSLGNETT
jgi:hypothetical protein